MKVVVILRVLFPFRLPWLRRLATRPDVDLVVFHGEDFPGTKTVNAKDRSGFESRELRTWRLVSRVDAVREIAFPFWPGLTRALARERPDVVLAEGGSNLPANLVLFAWAALTRTPIAWWTLGEVRHPEPLGLLQRLFRAVVRGFERRATALLGYSSAAGEYFDRAGHPKEKQFVAVNCIDDERVDAGLAADRDGAARLREELGLGERRVLLFVGAIAPYKRVEDLVEVYGRLRARRDDVALVVVGGGPHLPAVQARAEAVGAGDAIFPGPVHEGVGAWFELGDVLVLPALGGLALSEAATHGLPLVATVADGTEEDLVVEGENGHLLEVGDLDAMERVLDALLSDPERLAAMGAASRRIVEQRVNIRNALDNLVACLAYACGRAQPPSSQAPSSQAPDAQASASGAGSSAPEGR